MSVHPWKTVPLVENASTDLCPSSFLPAIHQCPAGEDIQGWLFYAESGNYEKAWRHLTRRNPLPSCMGRVCYHTCEGACNRGKLDASVGINSVERFLGDNALENGYKFQRPEQKTGKQVLIVGSGPAACPRLISSPSKATMSRSKKAARKPAA